MRNVLAASAFLGVLLPALPAAAQAGLVSAVLVGPPDPNGKVPGLNVVAGSGVNTLSVADPVAVLTHGQAYVITMAAQDLSFTGTCVDSWKLTRGTSVLARGVIRSFACQAGTYWIWAGPVPAIPNSPGPATLIGTMKLGTSTAKLSVPVLIQ